jgi:hypothetical protein
MTYENKSSAELEREVEQQRNRVEQRIGEIKDRLSPGQLLDEALSYTRHGGAHFASNLGQQISANPLPAALAGVGLAWLIASTASGNNQSSGTTAQPHTDYDYYPYANIKTGGLKRISHSADESGEWWSEFETSGGDRYKAKSNSLGERAGHFTDQAGKMFSGFIDETGNRVRDFQDEAGNRLSDAQGWANHSWHDLRDSIGAGLGSVGSAARHAASGLASGTRHLGGTMQNQTDQMTRQIVSLFDQQPLIAGALAFAAGAALGAALPHTEQEDQLIGKQADKVRKQASRAAGKLYEQGKEQAAGLYEEATDKASQLYSETKDRVADLARPSDAVGATSNSRH